MRSYGQTPIPRYAEGRQCRNEDCDTILSIYNPFDECIICANKPIDTDRLGKSISPNAKRSQRSFPKNREDHGLIG